MGDRVERRRSFWGIAGALLALGGVAGGLACRSEPAPSATAPSAAADREKSEAKPGEAAAPTALPPPAEPAPSMAAGDGQSGVGAAPSKARAPAGVAGERGGFAFKGNAPAPQTVGGEPASPPPDQAEAAIDPNGRFATTYRPGGGHLAAFESAVARGIVPAGERELVSDVGARYAPAIEAPKGKALAVRTELERDKVAPGGGPTHVRVTLRSTADPAQGRPHLSVHLVLDVSGSMKGDPMAQARDAAQALVDKLAPTDDFSLVTFSSDAEVRVPDGPVGPRRASIKQTIASIVEGGGTNIGRGLELGYQQATTKTIPQDAVKVVLMLSDGRANAGVTSSDRLARMALDAFQSGIQTSTFGLGADYDGALMSSIAMDGAGGYYYLRDGNQIAPALATELDKRLDPVATAVELRVRLKPDVKLYQVYGSRRLSEAEAARVRAVEVAADAHAQKRDGIKKDREDDTKGGMRFFIPAFARDDSHAVLIKLGLPAGVGARDVALIELKYKDRVTKKNATEEVPIKVTFANGDADSAASSNASVARTIQGFAAGEALAEASRHIALGDRARAVALLSEREGILRTAAQTLNEPLFLKDADRLARLRNHAGSNAGVGDPLVLAMLLETAARSHLH